MPDDKVVSLRNEPIKDVRKIDASVVSKLEELLERAKSGEIVGVAGAICFFDMTTHQFSRGVASWATVGRLQGVVDHHISELKGAK